jgi:hypothetical protein
MSQHVVEHTRHGEASFRVPWIGRGREERVVRLALSRDTLHARREGEGSPRSHRSTLPQWCGHHWSSVVPFWSLAPLVESPGDSRSEESQHLLLPRMANLATPCPPPSLSSRPALRRA